MMGRLSERQRMQLALIFAAALLLLYLLVLAPLFRAETEALRAAREEHLAALVRVEAYQKMLLADPAAEKEMRARQAWIAHALPEERGQGRFIRWVEQRALQSGVTVKAVAPEQTEHAEGIAVQSFRIEFQGSYFAVLSFLGGLAEGERAVRFGPFALTAGEEALHCVLRVDIASAVRE